MSNGDHLRMLEIQLSLHKADMQSRSRSNRRNLIDTDSAIEIGLRNTIAYYENLVRQEQAEKAAALIADSVIKRLQQSNTMWFNGVDYSPQVEKAIETDVENAINKIFRDWK